MASYPEIYGQVLAEVSDSYDPGDTFRSADIAAELDRDPGTITRAIRVLSEDGREEIEVVGEDRKERKVFIYTEGVEDVEAELEEEKWLSRFPRLKETAETYSAHLNGVSSLKSDLDAVYADFLDRLVEEDEWAGKEVNSFLDSHLDSYSRQRRLEIIGRIKSDMSEAVEEVSRRSGRENYFVWEGVGNA